MIAVAAETWGLYIRGDGIYCGVMAFVKRTWGRQGENSLDVYKQGAEGYLPGV